jgi:hypothetical protein
VKVRVPVEFEVDTDDVGEAEDWLRQYVLDAAEQDAVDAATRMWDADFGSIEVVA